MANRSVEQSTNEISSNIQKLNDMAKRNVEIMNKSGNATTTALSLLVTGYQNTITRNGEFLAEAIKALSSAKTPLEFSELQQKLIQDSFEKISSDAEVLIELTSSVFTAAFEPIQKQITVIPEIVKTISKLPWAGPTMVG